MVRVVRRNLWGNILRNCVGFMGDRDGYRIGIYCAFCWCVCYHNFGQQNRDRHRVTGWFVGPGN